MLLRIGHEALADVLQYHQSVIDNVRQSVKDLPGRPVAIALDTVCYTPTDSDTPPDMNATERS